MNDFYSKLRPVTDFSGIATLDHYAPVPGDWHVVIADVKGSTAAIGAGEYKAVNIIGVSVITSILNATKPVDIPYIFGGDGATLCIPGSMVPVVRDALLTTRRISDQQFGLGLRIGIVPVLYLRESGHDVLVARHRVSDYYMQAAFSGGGIDHAEALIKNDDTPTTFRIEASDEQSEADYSGLECRWENVPSRHGETISLIVRVTVDSPEIQADTYNEIIEKIQQVYGDENQSRPIYEEGLNTTLDGRLLKYEYLARTVSSSLVGRVLYWLIMRVQVSLGKMVMKFNLKTGGIDWGRYRSDAVRNADYRKYDGVLRQVLSGTPSQRAAIEAYLEELYHARKCFYGIHVSDSALITCIINNRLGGHYHFVDGADGGYAMAATRMKKQIALVR